ncbi:MAG: hypothetical protein KAG66_07190, partial [Methylococcales bacterium]|nr:hypothetical protein [Methylococcales bacterium]
MKSNMFFLPIEQAAVRLESDSEWIRKGWHTFFNFGLRVRENVPENTPILGRIVIKVREKMPAFPTHPPLFQDKQSWGSNERRTLSVYPTDTPSHMIVIFHEGAYIHIPVGKQATTPLATITIQPHFDWGRLEDVTMLTLATMLRPHGYFMVHAFAATWGSKAILLVGSRHSGKTTTGLNLVSHGWQFLGNDVILLKAHQSGIVALPSPGII